MIFFFNVFAQFCRFFRTFFQLNLYKSNKRNQNLKKKTKLFNFLFGFKHQLIKIVLAFNAST